jgi:cytochrome P450
MTSVHIHQNENIFPEAQKFKPERWLEKRPEGAPPLDRYLVSFTKGSRQCVGMQYVQAEFSDRGIYLPFLVSQRLNCDLQLQQ